MLRKAAMVRHLVVDHQLDGEHAELLIREADNPRVKAPGRLIKYAWGEPPMSADFNDPVISDEYGIRAPTQYPQTELQNLSQNDNAGAREAYRDDRYIDDAAKRYAVSAGNMGQKEVLDTSVISGLAKTLDADSAVDGYISDLLLALDRLGRILFMYYWHNDKFKERYGQQDMMELEDNLRNVFKNLGEVTLYLKQKTIEPDEAGNSEVELPAVLA
jgi:hypothetical protein